MRVQRILKSLSVVGAGGKPSGAFFGQSMPLRNDKVEIVIVNRVLFKNNYELKCLQKKTVSNIARRTVEFSNRVQRRTVVAKGNSQSRRVEMFLDC